MPIRLLARVSVLYSAKGAFNGSRLIWYFRRGCCLTRTASLRILLPQEASIIPAAGSRRFRTPLSCTMHLVGGYPPPSAALLQQKRSQKETIIPDLSFVRISRTDEKRATGLQKAMRKEVNQKRSEPLSSGMPAFAVPSGSFCYTQPCSGMSQRAEQRLPPFIPRENPAKSCKRSDCLSLSQFIRQCLR